MELTVKSGEYEITIRVQDTSEAAAFIRSLSAPGEVTVVASKPKDANASVSDFVDRLRGSEAAKVLTILAGESDWASSAAIKEKLQAAYGGDELENLGSIFGNLQKACKEVGGPGALYESKREREKGGARKKNVFHYRLTARGRKLVLSTPDFDKDGK